jgi:actin-related protein
MENMVLTGGGSLMAGAQRRIKSEMINHLPVSDNAGDLQPRLVKFLRIPDYFTVLKESKYQQYTTWLGSLIVAKVKKVSVVCSYYAKTINLLFTVACVH